MVGPDGAGKSTLLRALVGLLEIEADESLVLGYDLRKDVTALKAHIGYVPQVFSLHRDLTIAENLRFTARLHRLPAAEADQRIAALLERTALSRFATASFCFMPPESASAVRSAKGESAVRSRRAAIRFSASAGGRRCSRAVKRRFSAMVRSRCRLKTWGTYPMCAFSAVTSARRS